MTVIEIKEEADIVKARTTARQKARDMGFGLVDQTRISTGTSELARNIYVYAGKGEVHIEETLEPHHGIRITFIDQGPGIENVELALQDGWSSSSSLGKGLAGSKRLANRLDINSAPGQGTTVIYERWLQA